MTKDDLKRLKALQDGLAALAADIGRQEDIVLRIDESKHRWAETVMMSSPDEACRTVGSQVVSRAADSLDDVGAKRRLKQLRWEYLELECEYDAFLVEAEAWLITIPDLRLRRFLKLRYLENHDLQEVAEITHFAYQTVSNEISTFWATCGK